MNLYYKLKKMVNRYFLDKYFFYRWVINEARNDRRANRVLILINAIVIIVDIVMIAGYTIDINSEIWIGLIASITSLVIAWNVLYASYLRDKKHNWDILKR